MLTYKDLSFLFDLLDNDIKPSTLRRQEQLQSVVNKLRHILETMVQGDLVLTPKRTYTSGADGAVKRARKSIQFTRDADVCTATIGSLTLNYHDVFKDDMAQLERLSEGTLRYMFRKIVLVSVALWEYRKGCTITNKMQLSALARDLIVGNPKITAVKAVSYLRRKLSDAHLER